MAAQTQEGAFDYRRKIQLLSRIGPFQDRLDGCSKTTSCWADVTGFE